jgi:hypothetical protein
MKGGELFLSTCVHRDVSRSNNEKMTYKELWQKFDNWVINVHPFWWVAIRVIGFVIGLTVWFFAFTISIIFISINYDVSFIKYFPLLGTCILLVGLIYVLVFRKQNEE